MWIKIRAYEMLLSNPPNHSTFSQIGKQNVLVQYVQGFIESVEPFTGVSVESKLS